MSVTGSSIWELKRYGVIQYNLLFLPSVRDFIMGAEKWSDDDICYEIAGIRDLADDREYVRHRSAKFFCFLYSSSQLFLPLICLTCRTEQVGHNEFTHTSDLWAQTEINWKLLSTVTQEITFREDDVMLQMNTHNEYLFFIKKGHAKVKVC